VRRWPAPVVLATSFGAGAVPFDNVAARFVAGTDLRHVGTGTVSGSSLMEVAGFPTLAVAGCCDLAKGGLGPALAGRERPYLAALAAGAAVVGHDWSPFLRGAGGRGISPSLGAMLVAAPEGVAVLGAALGVGRLLHHTGLSTFVGALALFPMLTSSRGRAGLLLAACVVSPMLVKRAVGNHGTLPSRASGWLNRIVLDRDEEANRAGRT
jgi:acyl phosphate:glycerol-3-phosphate acyltransferase